MAENSQHHGVASAWRRKFIILPVLTLVAVVAMPGGGEALALPAGWEFEFSAPAFQELILSWGAWGVAGSVVLMIVHSFIPFPAEFLAIANGVVWGPVKGVAVTWVGAMGGAIITFALVRAVGDRFVRRMVPERRWRRIDGWVERRGIMFFLVARLIPIISFDLLNIAAGLTRMTWWTFLWTTGLAILPMTSLMVVMGDRFDEIPVSAWILGAVAIMILCLVSRRGFGEVREIDA